MHWDQMTATPDDLRARTTRLRCGVSQLGILESILEVADGPWLGAMDADGRGTAELRMHLAGQYRLTAVVSSAGKLNHVHMIAPRRRGGERILSSKAALRRGFDENHKLPKQNAWLDYVLDWVSAASQAVGRPAVIQWRLVGADRSLAAMDDTIESLRASLREREQLREDLAGEIADLRAELVALTTGADATQPTGQSADPEDTADHIAGALGALHDVWHTEDDAPAPENLLAAEEPAAQGDPATTVDEFAEFKPAPAVEKSTVIESAAAAEQSTGSAATIEVEVAAAAGESVTADDPSAAIQQSVVVEELIDADELATVEDSTVVDETDAADPDAIDPDAADPVAIDPDVAGDLIAADSLIAVDDLPAAIEHPFEVGRPVEVDQPVEADQPAAVDQPAGVEGLVAEERSNSADLAPSVVAEFVAQSAYGSEFPAAYGAESSATGEPRIAVGDPENRSAASA